MQSTFVSGLSIPIQIAFQDETLPIPEPSTLGLLAAGLTLLLIYPSSLTRQSGAFVSSRRWKNAQFPQ
jgi:hypothetical protein